MNRERPRDLRTEISRRRLLSGLGALTLTLTAPIWRSSTAFGQDTKQRAAKRFIGIFSANGTIDSAFFPATTAPESPLTLGRILKPLEKHTAKLLVLKGVHMNSTVEDELGKPSANKPGGPHMKGPGAMLTGGSLAAGSFTGSGGPAGWADRVSVDQFIAKRFAEVAKANGTPLPPFQSLEFGVRVVGQEPLKVISYKGANAPNEPVQDPWLMYSRLFADAGLSAAELARVLEERRSVLDFLKEDIGRLQTRVSSEDKARLEAHLGGIRNIEQRLSTAAVACTPLNMPGKLDPMELANYPAIGRLQTDLMILAHTCGLTRVSTFMWANADSWQYYPFVGVNEEHHELSHAGDGDTESIEKLIKINIWHSEQVAYLLDRLEAAKEVDGSSLLDNSLVLWGNELGAGNTHTYKNIPWVLAGGAGGYLKTGRYLRYADEPHNNLLVSVCNAMGFDDVRSFGIPGVCTGPLANLAV